MQSYTQWRELTSGNFVGGRATLDLTTMLRRVFDSQKTSSSELLMVSVEINKAFDSLRRDALTHLLGQALQQQHPDSVQYLVDLYTEQFLTLRRGERLTRIATWGWSAAGRPRQPSIIQRSGRAGAYPSFSGVVRSRTRFRVP